LTIWHTPVLGHVGHEVANIFLECDNAAVYRPMLDVLRNETSDRFAHTLNRLSAFNTEFEADLVTQLTEHLVNWSLPQISRLAAINFFTEDVLTPKKVAEITGELYESLTRSDFDSVNATLSQLDPTRAAETAVLAVLRGTFNARKYLHAWQPAVDRAAEAFAGRGRNPQRLLRGLLARAE
jgi:hypothetical protein